jgi:hypothetical protein
VVVSWCGEVAKMSVVVGEMIKMSVVFGEITNFWCGFW